MFSGLRRSVSRVAGPPPRTSTPAVAPFSHRMTVQPVAASTLLAWPIFTPRGTIRPPIFRLLHPLRSMHAAAPRMLFPPILPLPFSVAQEDAATGRTSPKTKGEYACFFASATSSSADDFSVLPVENYSPTKDNPTWIYTPHLRVCYGRSSILRGNGVYTAKEGRGVPAFWRRMGGYFYGHSRTAHHHQSGLRQ